MYELITVFVHGKLPLQCTHPCPLVRTEMWRHQIFSSATEQITMSFVLFFLICIVCNMLFASHSRCVCTMLAVRTISGLKDLFQLWVYPFRSDAFVRCNLLQWSGIVCSYGICLLEPFNNPLCSSTLWASWQIMWSTTWMMYPNNVEMFVSFFMLTYIIAHQSYYSYATDQKACIFAKVWCFIVCWEGSRRDNRLLDNRWRNWAIVCECAVYMCTAFYYR